MKTTHTTRVLSFVVLLSLVWIGSAFTVGAQETAAEREAPLLTLGVLTAEDYVEGVGDVVIPLYYRGDGLIFLNPRVSVTDRDAEEYNIGLGYRHLISERRAVLGGNLFYDHRETRAGSSFDQLGAGLEYLSYAFDARVNFYYPLNDKEKVAEFTTVEESASRRNIGSTEVEWGEPYASGNSILQPFSGSGSMQVRTTTTTTTRQFRQYEIAMRGWDAEVGVLLPIEPIKNHARVKTFAGYYKYYGKHGVDDLDGFRGRLELHLRPGFFLDATYYSDDELTGGNVTLGAYVSLPFDIAAISARKNPFAGAADRWDAGNQRDDMTYRLVDMVKRDPQIRSQLGEVEEQKDKATVTTRTRTKTTGEGSGTGVAVVVDNMTFVDRDNEGNENQDGTFENPYESIELGVDNANSPVWVFDSTDPYTENVEVPGGIHLYGNGTTIEAFDGKTWGGGIYPVLIAPNPGPAITILGNNVVVSGFDIRHSGAGAPGTVISSIVIDEDGYQYDITHAGIFGRDVSDLQIHDNIMTDGSLGNGIVLLSDGTLPGGNINLVATLLNNDIQDAVFNGLVINAVGGSGEFNVQVSGNYSFSGDDGIRLWSEGHDTARADLYDITANNNDNGLDVKVMSTGPGADAIISIMNLTANANDSDGIANLDAITEGAGSHARILIDGAEINDNGSRGIDNVDAVANGLGGNAYITFKNITALNNDTDGIEDVQAVGNQGGASIWFEDIIVNNTGGDGFEDIHAYAYGDNANAVIILNNVTANNNDSEGIREIEARAYGMGGNALIQINNVTANGNYSEGIDDIEARADDGGARVEINNLIANNNGDDGVEDIDANAYGANANAEIYIFNSQFNNNGGYGVDDIEARAYGENGHAIVVLENVEANNNEYEGLESTYARTYGINGNASIEMDNVRVIDNGSYGMDYVEAHAYTNGGNALVRMHNIIATGNDNDGIWRLQAEAHGDNGNSLVDVLNLTANNNRNSGISYVYSYARGANGDADVVLNNVTLNYNDEYGIDQLRAVADDGAATVLMNNVTINGNGDGGIYEFTVTANGAGDAALVTIEGLTMINNNGDGLEDVEVTSNDGAATFNLSNSTITDNSGMGVDVVTTANGLNADAINNLTNINMTNNTGGPYSLSAIANDGGDAQNNIVNVNF